MLERAANLDPLLITGSYLYIPCHPFLVHVIILFLIRLPTNADLKNLTKFFKQIHSVVVVFGENVICK